MKYMSTVSKVLVAALACACRSVLIKWVSIFKETKIIICGFIPGFAGVAFIKHDVATIVVGVASLKHDVETIVVEGTLSETRWFSCCCFNGVVVYVSCIW